MAKLSDLSLEELYSKKITPAVERTILIKDVFSTKSDNWCEKACRLSCKNPPAQEMFNSSEVDVLVIQDYNAFDEVRFGKKGSVIEKKHREILQHMFARTLVEKLPDGGFKKLRVGITTMLKCQLTTSDLKKGKPPTDTVLSKCSPYLLAEIEARKPKVIVSMSKVVTNILGIKKSNSRNCGDVYSYKGIPVVLTLHPRVLVMLRQNASGAMWGPDFYSIIERDLVKAAWLFNGGLQVPDVDATLAKAAKEQVHVLRDISSVEAAIYTLTNKGIEGFVLSFDIETSSIDPFSETAKVLCVQFGVRNEESGLIDAYVFPLYHRNNVWVDPAVVTELLRPLLEDDQIKKVGHNVKFDILYTDVVLGIKVRGVVFDTMLITHAINSGIQGMYGLKRAICYWIPDLGFQGYEDRLPALTKTKKVVETEIIEGEEYE